MYSGRFDFVVVAVMKVLKVGLFCRGGYWKFRCWWKLCVIIVLVFCVRQVNFDCVL